MEGRLPDQPDREHGNPLKPVRTRDDVEKKWPMRSPPNFDVLVGRHGIRKPVFPRL